MFEFEWRCNKERERIEIKLGFRLMWGNDGNGLEQVPRKSNRLIEALHKLYYA